MAKRDIKTTLALDGERTFKAAIQDINKNMALLGSELSKATAGFDRNDKSAAKLAATNEILAKKIIEQKKAVAETSNALAEAKKAYGENSNEAKEYQIQLNKAEAALTRMEKELDDNAKAIKEQGEEADKAGEKIEEHAEQVDKAEKKSRDWGETLKRTGDFLGGAFIVAAKTAAIAVGAIVTVTGAAFTGMAKLADMAGEFETAANKVATLDLSKTPKELEQINKGMLDVSSSTGLAAGEVAEATYQMASAMGELSNDVADYTEIAAKAAVGGFTDTTTAVNGLSTVMNAYGETSSEAMQKFADQMLVTQNLGKTSFGEIADSIGNVIPIAAQMGVESEELFASYAVLTKNGIATSQATTGLKAAISNIVKPTSQATKMADKLGIEFNAAALESKGLEGMMDEISKATNGNTEQMAQLFGSVEALNSVMVLTSTDGLKDFQGAIDAMGNATGSTEAAFEKMTEGFEFQKDKLINQAKNLGIELGTNLLPAAKDLVAQASEIMGVVSTALSDGFQPQDIQVIGEAISKKLMDGISKVSEYLPDIIKTISGALQEAVKVIVKLLPTLLPMLFDGAMELMKGILDTIKANLKPIMDAVIYIMLELVNFFVMSLPLIIEIGIQVIVALVQGLAEALPTLIPVVIEAIMLIVDSLLGSLDLLIPAALEIILALTYGLINALPKLSAKIPEIVTTIVTVLMENLPAIIQAAIEIIIALIAGLIMAIPEIILAMPRIIEAIVKSFKEMDWGKLGGDIISGMVNGVKNAASNLVDSLMGVATQALDSVKRFLGIASPSKVFRDQIGLNMGLGIADGLTKAENDINKSLQDVIPTDIESKYNLAFDAGIRGQAAEIRHTHAGVIRVEGVNDEGQLVGVANMLLDQLRMEKLLAGV